MKVLAIYTGRKEQYSEYLAKTALMGARDEGMEVQAVNLLDLTLKPCIGCKFCHMFENGTNGDCVLKDDMAWLDEQIYEADGIIVCLPIYEKTVPGEFKILMDRTGPSHDLSFREHMVKLRQEGKVKNPKPVDERSFKRRPITFIAHGGTDWGSLAMPVMELWAIPMGFQLVNMLELPWNIQIFFEEDRIRQVYEAGKQVAEAVRQKAEHPEMSVEYKGTEGYCPVCHSSTFVLKNWIDVECAVCSVKGTIHIENGKMKCEFDPLELAMSQMLDGGRQKHLNDINGFAAKIFSMDFMKLAQMKAEHMRWLPSSKPVKDE